MRLLVILIVILIVILTLGLASSGVEAASRNVNPIGFWQSEVGNTEDPTFYASRYPKLLYDT